jgi:hypothetical protein
MDVTNLFGTGVTVDTTTPADPVLQIPFSAIATVSAWDTAPTSGTDSAEQWFTAIFLKAKAHLATITDGTNNVAIDDPFKTNETRNEVDMIGYSHNVTIYQPDLNGTAPDPDNV